MGGMDAWKQAGYPMATGDPVKPQPTNTVAPSNTSSQANGNSAKPKHVKKTKLSRHTTSNH